ncbi:unnamed protein product [Brachionus calyciflorus]|uniref:ISXO2-like transposase domain-containing protein n=1 Tax=Brachionus calyciflorus TaxID=104777 RepID=A0A814N249_9BILA|nr:unnamed protein product [Brachionus calyciflorus]
MLGRTFNYNEDFDQFSNGQCYPELVPDRNAETLLSIIYEKCLPDSIIFSDCWASYNKISELKDFKHKTISHTLYFLNPDTGRCTKRIESFWNSSKHRFKEMRGFKRANVQSYLDELVWRFNNNGWRTSQEAIIHKAEDEYDGSQSEVSDVDSLLGSLVRSKNNSEIESYGQNEDVYVRDIGYHNERDSATFAAQKP